MFIIVILTAMILMFIVKLSKLDKFSKWILTIYNLIVTFLLCFSMTNPASLYPVSDKTYILWILNIVIFTVIYVVFALRKTNRIAELEKTETKWEEAIEKITNSKVWLFFQIGLMIILLYYVIKYNYIVSQTTDQSLLRLIRFTNLFGSYTEKVIFEYLIMGLFTIFSIITSILFVNKKWKNLFFFIGLINIILYISIGFSRKVLFEFLIYVVLAYIITITLQKKKISKRSIIIGICLVIIILVLTLGVTALRTGVSIFDFKKIYNVIIEEQIKQFIVYFEGPFRALDHFVENGFSSLQGNLSYGRATLGGIDEIISLPLIFIGFQYPYFNSIVGAELQNNILVGETQQFNALYTSVMNYYCDFGVVGVIIIPALYAIFVRWCIEKFIRKKDIFSQVLAIFVIMNTFSTIYRWNYQAGSTTFWLIILLLLNSNKIKE